MDVKAVVIIPARLGSTRFPGKVLAAKTGKPLIQHVYERALRASCVARVVVAAGEPEIVDAVEAFGGTAVLTGDHHLNGTSRIGEAAERLALGETQIIVNVQGDEPEIEPALIDRCIEPVLEGSDVGTVASPFGADETPSNPNIVKVVCGLDGRAMYFSRSLIPHRRSEHGALSAPLKHVGIYAYRVGFLTRYASLAPTPLEQTEQLEQLRVLEHGMRIGVVIADVRTTGIDTPEQYEAFVGRWRRSDSEAL